MRRSFRAAPLALLAGLASAQLVPTDPDWKEQDAPAPPALRTEGLIPLPVTGSSLRFGVDPASIAIGADGVVRYVVVAQGEGVVNGIYEGIRCNTGEVKVFARHQPGAGWVASRSVDWLPLHDNRHARYSLVIARNGACVGHGTNSPASQIAKDLARDADRKFERR